MKSEILGGLEVRTIEKDRLDGLFLLGENPYQYKMLVLQAGQKSMLTGQDTYCVFLYAPVGIECAAKIDGQALKSNQTLWVKKTGPLELEGVNGSSTLLIASKVTGVKHDQQSRVFDETEVKKVVKPWGYELWLTGDPSPIFAFKKIFIKAGTKTSLQYHVQKRETNFLVEGEANLHYNPDPTVHASAFKSLDVAIKQIAPLTVIDVFPLHIHRLEAVSDILLFEVSTPELDDVVRISDDSGRKDGRITSEHKV